jgi:hypothetical protein
VKRYVITYCQNDTPVHSGFWAALKHLPAKKLVVRGFYHNPTSLYEKYKEEETSWAPELSKFLVDEKMEIVPGRLTLHANIRVQPTASNPLSGLEVYAGEASAIIGHTKRAIITVATATRMPRLLISTGACTVANYSHSKAGAKGEAHHVIGASIIEVDDSGRFFAFQISWDHRTKSFTHLDTRYSPDGAAKAPPALALIEGDLHAGKEDPAALAATDEQLALLRPQQVYHHDTFDNNVRNHHEKKRRSVRYALRNAEVKAEVVYSARLVKRRIAAAPWADHRFVRSNHDEALDRWLEEHDGDEDPTNDPYYCALKARLYDHYEEHGVFPDAWPFEMERLGVKATFLKRNDETSKVAGINCGFHGDSGINGARGNVQQYRKLGVKVIVGHGHYFYWQDGVMMVGHLSVPDHGYNKLPNGWMQGNGAIYADGKRTTLMIIEGHWRINKRGR